jgi:hypothetical protein
VGKEWRFSRAGLLLWVTGIEIGHDPEQAYFWTERWQQMEREAEADIKAGRVYRSKPGEDPVNALHRFAEDIED